MSDDALRTRVDTDEGELAFQDYFVRRRCAPRFRGLRFEGAAAPSLGFRSALADPGLAAIVICPSNPLLSIRPLLALPGIDAALRARRVPAVAVSPIVGGNAVKGPLAKMMQELGLPTTALEIARMYTGLIDAFVIDEADEALAPAISSLGLSVRVAPTLMTDAARQRALAQATLDLAGR
jgi:LPPG:FO 2-phospho-L-lactate transferase